MSLSGNMRGEETQKIVTALTLAAITLVVSYASFFSPSASAEAVPLGVPSITATV